MTPAGAWWLRLLALRRQSLPGRCATAIVLVLVVLVGRLAVIGAGTGTAYVPFVPAVIGATLLLGLLPGLLAAAFSWATAVFWFVEPVGSFYVSDWTDVAFALFFPAAAAAAAVAVEAFLAAAGIEEDG